MSALDTGKVPGPRQTRQRRSAIARVFYSLFVLLALGTLIAGGLGIYGYSGYVARGPLDENRVFDVAKGLRAPEIASALDKAGIIDNPDLFTAAAYATGKRGKLKAGEYEFPKGASIRDVLALIASGKVILHKVTIPEGWTTFQAIERIKANEALTGEVTKTPAEGDILPDTYVFRRGKNRDELVAEMIAARDKLLDELWDKRAAGAPVKSKDEAIVLASIVEKETGKADERPQVAAVFANRLNKGMRLQSDPTIIYGITLGQGKLDRPIRRSDIDAKTAYNTYQIDGLPPGPIANPGRAALEAALNPAATSALYFVADGTGGHAFAATLEEHNANVVKWRQIEKNRGQVEAAAADREAKAKAKAATDAQAAVAPADQPSAADTAAPVAEAPPPAAGTETRKAGLPDGDAINAPEATVTAGDVAIAPPEAEVEEAAIPEPKPGSLIKIAKRLVPIPVPKPAAP